MTELIPLSVSTHLILSDFLHFCFSILSQPLYFSYFIFFFPYIIKLISFLSPLIITTTFLLLLAFFTVSSPDNQNGHGFPHNQDMFQSELPESKLGFLSTARIGQEVEEVSYFEELELYKIVFESSRFDFEARENEIIPFQAAADVPEMEVGIIDPSFGSKSVIIEESEKTDQNKTESKAAEEFKDIEVVSNINVNENHDSKAEGNDFDSEEMEKKSMMSFRSVRKEKQWRSTLACKLFEEIRDNNFTSIENEKMDLLWEVYETESMNKAAEAAINSKKNLKSLVDQHEDDDDDEYEEEESEGKICCLQALKLSTGKLRFGIGKTSSLKKISKAIKGLKLLHKASKNSKKSHS